MTNTEPLGFIGLGIMGFPMAENLLRAGHALTVFNRNRRKAEELEKRGAAVAASPGEVARRAKVIFLCVGDSESVCEIAEALLQDVQPGTVLVDATTISPTVSRGLAARFQEHGAEFLDAPCSGSKKGAESGTLTFMVGGKREVFERVEPYLSVMGRKIFYMGGQGMGLQVKLTQNLIGALTYQAMSEGFVLAAKAGLEPEKVLQVLEASVAHSPMISAKLPAVLARRFEPNFSLKWMHKDIGLMLESGRELHVPLPVTALVHELFGASIAQGHGEEDFAAAITLLETLAGAEVSTRPPVRSG